MHWLSKLKKFIFQSWKYNQMSLPVDKETNKLDAKIIAHVLIVINENGQCQGIAIGRNGSCYFESCEIAKQLALGVEIPVTEISHCEFGKILTPMLDFINRTPSKPENEQAIATKPRAPGRSH